MSHITHPPFDLVRRPGRVFETLGVDEHWAQGDYEDGHEVTDTTTPLNYMVVECHFILPRLPHDEPGKYPILTVARGCADAGTEVFFHLVYEPYENRFILGANAGSGSSRLQVVELEGAPAQQYTGQLLQALVLIAPNGIFPSLTDAFVGQPELSGELVLDRSGHGPWGGPATGTWWITSGAESELDDEERCFPAGFGLSDVRVTVFDETTDFDKAAIRHATSPGNLLYSGALDHLVSETWDEEANPFGVDDDWELGDEESIADMLLDLANELRIASGGVSTWARRAESLAEESQFSGRIEAFS